MPFVSNVLSKNLPSLANVLAIGQLCIVINCQMMQNPVTLLLLLQTNSNSLNYGFEGIDNRDKICKLQQ